MDRIFKVALVAGGAVVAALATIILGPILFMVAASALASLIMSATSDSAFEEDFAKIPEVRLFTTEYPDYATSHGGDFLGWKVISYWSDWEPAPVLYVKKSVLHHGVRVLAGCDDGSGNFAFDVPQEAVADYIRNRTCGGGR